MNLLDLLFPKRCVGCGKWGKYFCLKCILHLPYFEHQICPQCMRPAMDGITHPYCKMRYSLDGLKSFFHYRGIVRSAIKSLKYRFITDLAQEFIDLIPDSQLTESNSAKATHITKTTTLIPIPLHPSRFRERGFNQAEILGNLISQKLNIPIHIDIISRIRKTTPQVEVRQREKRIENSIDAFKVNNEAIKQCNNVILFDDVTTTGATLRSATNVLKRAGVKSVWGIVMAHG